MNFTIKELNELIYSLGTTATKGMMCDKELNASLLDRLTNELSIKILSEAKEEVEENWSQYDFEDENGHYRGKYISNEEADEDATGFKLGTKEFNDMASVYFGGAPKDNTQEFGWITQSILDFVEKYGSVTYGAMNQKYRELTGSNSFSHILKALQIPYKNRPTRRYIRQIARGTYVVDIATPQNWVVKN